MSVSETAQAFCRVIYRLRVAVLLLWLCAAVAGAAFGFRFLDETSSDFVPPSSAESARAKDKLAEYFEAESRTASVTLYFESLHGQDLRSDAAFEGYVRAVSKAIGSANETDVERGASRYLIGGDVVSSVTDYFRAADAGLGYIAPLLCSADGRAILLNVAYTRGTTERDALNGYVLDKALELSGAHGFSPDALYVGTTGLDAFAIATLDGVKQDLRSMDTISLPLALLVLACVLRCLPLMLVPICTIAITLVTEYLIMLPVAMAIDVVSFAPSIMMSLTIAMSFDYSLFMLSRFMEEVGNGRTVDDAILHMVDGAGHTITISGGILICCFLTMLVFPLSLLQTTGLGAAVALFMCLLVNLTFTPAFLYCFSHDLFRANDAILAGLARAWDLARSCGRARAHGRDPPASSSLRAALLAAAEQLSDPFDLAAAELDAADEHLHLSEERRMRDSSWYKLGKVLYGRGGLLVVALVVGLVAPLSARVVDLDTSIATTMLVPDDAQPTRTLRRMGSTLGGGALAPYSLLLVPREGLDIFSERGFDEMDDIVDAIAAGVGPRTSFVGLTRIGTERVSFQDAAACAASSGRAPSPELCRNFFFVAETSAALATPSDYSSATAAYYSLTLEVDPYGAEGTQWLEDARDVIGRFTSRGGVGFDIYLAKGAAVLYDSSAAAYGAFPLMIAVTLALVFALLAIMFRSVVTPLRSVLSISLTLSFTFGLGVAVYEDGAFGSGVYFLAPTDTFCWLVPVMNISILVGLALDYDVFLIARVYEYRCEGFTDRAATLKGIYNTAYIVSAAGVLMCVAFGGLWASKAVILQQTAFCFVFAVLLDTFVVRTLCVPALLGLTDRLSWWPNASLPPPTKDLSIE